MPSAADQRLIDADPGLPALSRLLDDDAMTAYLQHHRPAWGVQSARGRYIRYKRGMSCLVTYDVVAASGPSVVTARIHPPNATEKFDKVAQRHGDDPLVVLDASEGLMVFGFPADHELRGLRGLADHPGQRALWSRLIPDRADLHTGSVEVLRYKPERRCVARLGGTTETTGAVIRFYTAEDFVAAKDAADAFRTTERVLLAPRLGRCKRDRTTAMGWLPGTSLLDCIHTEGLNEATAHAVGEAIGDLHRQRPRKLKSSWTAESFAGSLRDAADLLGTLHPPFQQPADDLATYLQEKICGRLFRAHRSIHGDLTPEQIIVDGGRIGLVDLDRAGYGDPRIDLGTLGARLRMSTGDDATTQRHAIVEGYRVASTKDVTRKLERYEAADLLRSAILPFRHRAADWVDQAARHLDEAARLLERPSPLST